jgi:multidrug transporter EmrE-like cation transporter
MRWKVSNAGLLPENYLDKLFYIFKIFTNPWIASSILATLFAGISWMLAMTKFEISYAYPWISLNFILMLLFGWLLFDEIMNINKLIGTSLVIFGVIIIAKG